MTQQPSQLSQLSQPPKIPMGQPIQWSDADLDALSQIREPDLKAAVAWWQNAAPRQYKELLQAQVEEEQAYGRTVTSAF